VVTKISFVMFCVVGASQTSIETKVHDTHEWLSKCHLEITEHSFNNSESECFCVQASE